MNIAAIRKMANWANDLDQTGDFAAADGLDLCLENLCDDQLSEEDQQFLIVVLKSLEEEQDLDDGRFGLNDADNPTIKAAMVRLAHSLDRHGCFAEADLVDQTLKTAQHPLPPQETAYTLYRIILHLLQRAGPEKQAQTLTSLRKSLNKLNALDIASKKSNPQAGVGAAMNVIKSMLNGQDPAVINSVLMELRKLI